jgi:GNAT superfamily N-acetyltransferase
MRDAYGIRPALGRDIKKLPAIEAAAALRFRETGHPEIADALPRSGEELAFAAEQGRLWVATFDGEPVGFALAIVLDGGAHLEEMDVLPAHGRRGLGAKLLAAVCDWAASRGASELTLTTYDDVEWNRAFYERHGFTVVEADRVGPGLAERMLEEARDGLDEARVAMSRKVVVSEGEGT